MDSYYFLPLCQIMCIYLHKNLSRDVFVPVKTNYFFIINAALILKNPLMLDSSCHFLRVRR